MNIRRVKVVLQNSGVFEVYGNNTHIYNYENAKDIFLYEIGHNNVECVGLICLDSDFKIINYSNIAIGSISNVHVSIAQIMRTALLSNASKIMVGHNHPSGILNCTQEDIEITRKIGKAANLLGISLLDSLVVVSSGEVLSIRERLAKNDVRL